MVFYASVVRDNGGYVVTFPDVPEAITQGDTVEEALDEAQDALIGALSFYIEDGRALPRSRRRKGLYPVALPPLVAAKLALYEAMRAEGMTGAKLARKLKVADTTVRRLLDLDHRSHIEEVERALAALGRRLVVSVARDAA
jgi:antitoxin HicB